MKTLKQKLFNIYWKTFVCLDYVIRYKKLPKSIKLTDKKNIVRINGFLTSFYSTRHRHGQIIWEMSKEQWAYGNINVNHQ